MAVELVVVDPHRSRIKSSVFMKRNVTEFIESLDEVNISEVCSDKHITLFEECCQTEGCSELIDATLKWAQRNGKLSELNAVNPYSGKSPINFAIASRDPENVKKLVKWPMIDVDHRNDQSITPLHEIIDTMNEHNFATHFELIRILITRLADVNAIPDEMDEPLVLIVSRNETLTKKQRGDVLHYIFQKATVDLNRGDQDLRKVLQEQYPGLCVPTNLRYEREEWTEKMLFDTLLKKDDSKNDDDEKEFLFGWSIFKNQNKTMFRQAWNIKSESGKSLLTTAVSEGMVRAVEVLLRSGADVNDLCDTGNEPTHAACDGGHHEILAMLMRSPGFDINRTPLLSRVIQQSKKMSRMLDYNKCIDMLLANNKIDIEQTDIEKQTPLRMAVSCGHKYAIKKLLKKGAYIGSINKSNITAMDKMDPNVLNEHFDSCIGTNFKRPDESDYQIVFDYTNLRPPNEEKVSSMEMSAIDYIAATPTYRHLIKHPLIASFVHLKWHQFKFIFYANFLTVLLYSLVFVPYVFFYYAKPSGSNYNWNDVFGEILRGLSIIGVAIILIREIFQFQRYMLRYILQFSNYVELALVAVSGCILCDMDVSLELRNSIAVTAILLVFSELFCLVGSLPIMSFSTYFVMLRTVFFTILKYMQLYSIMLFAFALCFNILLHNDENDTMNQFSNFGITMLKVLMMMTGEIDSSNLNIQHVFGYILLVIYILLFTVSMFNLLTGLAVSDAQMIKNDAELTYFLNIYEIVSAYGHICKGNKWFNRKGGIFKLLPLGKMQVLVNRFNYIICPTEQEQTIDVDVIIKTIPIVGFINPEIIQYAVAVLDKKLSTDEEPDVSENNHECTLDIQKNVLILVKQMKDVMARMNNISPTIVNQLVCDDEVYNYEESDESDEWDEE